MARLFLTITCVLLISSVAFSQHKQIERKALVFGGSLGLAHSIHKFPNNHQNNTDIGLDLKVGYVIKNNIAILLTTNVSSYNYSGGIGRDRKRDFGIVAPALQYWISDRLWVLGGAGLGVDAPIFWDIKNPDTDTNETKYYTGLGLLTGVGYEMYQKKNFAIDIKARLTYRNISGQNNMSGFSPAILLGFNFY